MTRRRVAFVSAMLLAGMLSAGLLYSQNTDRAKQVGGQLMCMCGCNEVLTQCNHVGCTVSAAMLKELDQRVQGDSSDGLILQSFVQEFGAKVLASPPAQGFNLLAWMIPGLAFGLGLAVVVVVIRHWRRVELAPAGGPAMSVSPEALERARHQIDLETED